MALQPLNPATVRQAGRPEGERKRVPMSVPVQKLEVPDIPGYHLHWFTSDPARIQRALDGGYEFVDEREVQTNNVSLGGDSAASGNTDMGSRVSVVSGNELGRDGQPGRLMLMKIKQEWYEEDQKLVEARNTRVADALTGGMIGIDTAKDRGDAGNRYVNKSLTSLPDMFKRKAPK